MGSENNMVAVPVGLRDVIYRYQRDAGLAPEDAAADADGIVEAYSAARLAQPDAQQGEFDTVEEHEHELQRQLSLLYNHRFDDGLQFNRGQMRTAIYHGMRLAGAPRLAQQGVSSPASGEGVEPRVFQAIHEALLDERDGKPCGCIVERGCEAAGYIDPESAADAFKAEVMARVLAVATPLAAATQPAAPQEKWQRIETAPRQIEYRCLVAHRFSVVTAYWDGEGWKNERSRFGSYIKPTHWMPLPEFPALTGAGENGEQGA